MAEEDLPTMYRRELGRSFGEYGHWLSEPALLSKLHVGVVGYFDDQDWHPIVDLNADAAILDKKGFKPFQPPFDPPDVSTFTWGPTVTSSMHQIRIGDEVGAGIPINGLPLKLELKFQLNKSETRGAVLVTDPPVEKTLLNVRESAWERWLKDNHGTLSTDYRSEFESGLHLITKTYATQKAYINMLETHQSDTEGNVGVEASVFVKLSANGQVETKGGAAEWTTSPGKPEEGSVVVVCGSMYAKHGQIFSWSIFQNKA